MVFDVNLLERITIVCGHYGCGKTNFSLNLALDMAKENKKVTVVDLDVVNPYFRSSDYQDLLMKKQIRVIAPKYAGTNLDTPSLSAEIESVFINDGTHIIFDVGGDDAGAFALGRYADKIKKSGYSLLYVVNKYRNLIGTPQQAIEILEEIMRVCGLQPSYIVNNSHLQGETTAKTILRAKDYAKHISQQLAIPVLCTTAPVELKKSVELQDEELYFVRQIVKPPFFAFGDFVPEPLPKAPPLESANFLKKVGQKL